MPALSQASLSRRPAASVRSVAQLVEHRSPKPGVAGSIPVTPATIKYERSQRKMMFKLTGLG